MLSQRVGVGSSYYTWPERKIGQKYLSALLPFGAVLRNKSEQSMKRQQHLVGMDWLHKRMEVLGMTSLEDAAKACGINRGTLHRYFSFEQRPSIDQLPPLCKGLKSPPLEVLRALKIQV